MITWKIDKRNKRKYRIDFEYSSTIYYQTTGNIGGAPNQVVDCIETGKLEPWQMKHFLEKMMDSHILYREIAMKFGKVAAKELLGIV